jgi:predicted metal-binding membrane protein
MTHAHAADAAGFWALTAMWFGMMAAMMAPTAWPWVRSVHRLSGSTDSSRAAIAGQFAAGYLVAWFAYSIAAALLQLTLREAGVVDPIAGMTSWAGAGVLGGAGLYQFAPLKHACVTHCRSPLGYFLARWRNGPSAGFRMGLDHGLYCVGCCWALMTTALAVGVMNLWWMAALGVIALIEQVAPHGHTVRRAVGAALLAAAVWRFSIGR